MSTMDRRQMITALAAMSATLGIPVSVLEAATKKLAISHQPSAISFDPRFFTPGELATATLLGDLIIPRDAKSGAASDAKVPEYMDFICAEYHSTGDWMRSGLNWLEGHSTGRFGKKFVDLTPDQRTAILDDISWPARAKPEHQAGVNFFNRFRDLTASGFWSSQMGVEDLQYIGNTFVAQWNGCPPEAKAKIGAN
ncbi:MAG TPA: gluconate 2-dehydrogenase subunit 3 family protein [Gemmatimonadales bacterium]|nr:gluconate 2-dehydrogenase subunit 3 family protein [Gemmatimonadales bacterium]